MSAIHEAALVVSLCALAVVAAALTLGWMPWLRSLVWSGRLPRRLGALPSEEVPADEAPRGWKCAQLLVSPDQGEIRLAGVTIGGAYRVEDVAACVLGRGHLPPSLSCECGFYAFSERMDAENMLACRFGYDEQVVVRVLCEVDLSGTVIVCDRGYRAERQRVLSIGLLPWCADCAATGRLVPARLVGTEGRLPTGAWVSVDELHASQGLHPSVRVRKEWAALRPLCEGCGELVGRTGTAFTLFTAAQRLGTEVRWLDAGLIAGERVLAGHRPRRLWNP